MAQGLALAEASFTVFASAHDLAALVAALALPNEPKAVLPGV